MKVTSKQFPLTFWIPEENGTISEFAIRYAYGRIVEGLIARPKKDGTKVMDEELGVSMMIALAKCEACGEPLTSVKIDV